MSEITTTAFPAKTYLCIIWTTLTRQYSYAILSQHCQHNTLLCIGHFHHKSCLLAIMANIAQVIYLCAMLAQTDPDKILYYFPVQS